MKYIKLLCVFCMMFLPVMVFAQGQIKRSSTTRTPPPSSNTVRRSSSTSAAKEKSVNKKQSVSVKSETIEGLMTDAQQMNIRGSIKKITEKSYYTYTTEYEEMKDQRIEDGELFDNCRFMSIVYGNEHLARLNYRNFLLQQVSDCDMFFNKDGNLTELTSLNPDGGFVRFHYEGSYNEIPLLKKMNIRENSHVEEEVIDFQYEKEGDNLVREIQQRRGFGYTINYLYESNRLVRAESNDYYVIYLRNGRIGTIRWPKFRNGRDLIIKIRYDESNYIVSVDWNEGSYKKAHIEFTYKLDRRGNWFERNAIVTYEYESKLMPAIIRTVREYEYY